MEVVGEQIILKPYTLESCHKFFISDEADSAMTYDEYVYDKENVDRYYQNNVLDNTRRFFAILHGGKVVDGYELSYNRSMFGVWC